MRALFFVLLLTLMEAVAAQTGGASLRAAQQAPDLDYPREPSGLSIFSGPKMALYKPDGAGPFPALVLMHQCGGLRSARGWQNMSVLQWARDAVAHGYVAMVVDSLGPRDVETVCLGPRNGVNFARGVRDALLAGKQLAALPYVDPQRVAVAGVSWGAMVSVLASSQAWATSLGDGFRFRAAAALYPGCFSLPGPGGTHFDVVNGDVDRPLLMLMGGQDTETPAAQCTARLAQLPAASITTHLYPEATHCWDCRNLDNFSKVDVRGAHVVYHYDAAVTQDSESRVFDFLARNMPPS